MWVADMDFECPPEIGRAASRRAAHNVYGYDIGHDRSAASTARWLSRRWGWMADPGWVKFSTGVVSGLGFAIRAFTAPGDGVVIQPPVYAPFRGLTEANGRRVITNPLRPAGGSYEMDFDDLDAKLAGARAMILCNPH
ncbi:MAG: aminotransferase class I/II-fold pyridoxal phosphate-dependent enzyme, partial [Alistipes sp.]|nr:aminotransferase class I/II-fold pyridoxal phosphate-dependent enzyme [Alistipes sp.]